MAMNEIVMVASIVTAVCAMVRTSLALWKPGFRLRRPLLLNAEVYLRQPVQPGEAGGVRVLAGLERPRVQRSVVSRRRG